VAAGRGPAGLVGKQRGSRPRGQQKARPFEVSSGLQVKLLVEAADVQLVQHPGRQAAPVQLGARLLALGVGAQQGLLALLA